MIISGEEGRRHPEEGLSGTFRRWDMSLWRLLHVLFPSKGAWHDEVLKMSLEAQTETSGTLLAVVIGSFFFCWPLRIVISRSLISFFHNGSQ